ncbi:E3 ubiquitin-protein ligase RMA3 [Ricinus communis]|uniref:E3 ubiquitin-protein ligase RMA n=1 Tax=Ricinus communis TaxID=3988 RepID=B9SNN5_RICCO|nr:E3 ubiquitin-protein ligase RMA3 [Ricinus communis]EEF34780.1 rnf5, putative [Ricinus communis]|eukprot:XP_002527599.1 E3 ubiquitin-protein ligase RMA3 [Ricinus communis]
MEPRFFEHDMHFDAEEDLTVKQKWKSVSAATGLSEDDDDCFSCNICLDSANDPVVTLCGHLYCWPCIYKWLQVKRTSSDVDEQQQQPSCPVCKANISSNSMVPLYGRGTSQSNSETKKGSVDAAIPRRPPPAMNTSITNTSQLSQQLHPNFFQSHSQSQPQSFHHQRYFTDRYGGYGALASTNLGAAAMTQIFSPMIGMFGELIFSRTFGTSNTSLFAYSYPNSNSLMGSYNSPRMRRQEMQLEQSLNRVTIFLLCCIILCLLLF